MAAEAAGRAYITTNEMLKAHLQEHSTAWLTLAELADKQDALIDASLS